MQNSLATSNIFNEIHQSKADSKIPNGSRAALPLEIQRAEKALRLDRLFECVRNFQKHQREQKKEEVPESNQCLNYGGDPEGNHSYNGVTISKKERRSDKKMLYNNVNTLTKSRRWLEEILLSDSSESECEDVADGVGTTEKIDNYVKSMLKEHAYARRCRKKFSKLLSTTQQKYMYYSTNLVLGPQQSFQRERASRSASPTATKPPVKQKKTGKLSDAVEKNSNKTMKVKVEKDIDCINQETPYPDFFMKEENTSDDDVDDDGHCTTTSMTSSLNSSRRQNIQSSNSNNDIIDPEPSKCVYDKSKSKAKKQANVEQMASRRKKLWIAIAKKDIPRTSKHKLLLRKDNLASLRKVAKECQKECRRMALASQKQSKEAAMRARRLFKEMQAYWKRFEKVEKEHRKKAEKEAMEQKKMDMEMKEMLRQHRKLNFLIAQTELYAHFMAGKLSGGGNDNGADSNSSLEPGCEEILRRFDEDKLVVKRVLSSSINGQQLVIRKKDGDDDDYDSQRMKDLALSNVRNAIEMQKNKVREFDLNERAGIDDITDSAFSDPSINKVGEWKQPGIFMGTLKSYQLKGMNWLANLYDQGINGILADEMGLGKTVQSVAFLAHLAEEQGIWGPFLVVAPASTLHNWLQEMTKFVPDFKVIPYWGTTQDRKVLRKFWNRSSSKQFPDITSKDSSFHVVITSYQMVVQDAKYFQQVNWHYMVLDEAQAIKSSNSSRWKSLLVFKCRNRLLLTGTPIQNSMAELWALLHFIMPTLFDSHDEFNEWFSKDIESHVEKQSSLDANQLSRLHMILKPFMLRRVKKDVENELSDKIEIQVCCPLMRRQRLLYKAIKNKISIEEILQSSSLSVSVTNNLMNIVMQLRKVCNHPELFERREIRSPCSLRFEPFYLPKLLYREGVVEGFSIDRRHLLTERFNIFNQHHIHHSMFHESSGQDAMVTDSCFSFTRFIDTSPNELCSIVKGGPLARWLYHLKSMKSRRLLHYQRHLGCNVSAQRHSLTRFMVVDDVNSNYNSTTVENSDTLRNLCFVRSNGDFFAHCDHKIRFMKESHEHRKVRLKNFPPNACGFPDDPDGSRWPFCSSPAVCDDDRFLDDPDDDEDGYSTTYPSDTTSSRRKPYVRPLVPTSLPTFLLCISPKVTCQGMGDSYTCDRSAEWARCRNLDFAFHGPLRDALNYGSRETKEILQKWKSQVQFSGMPMIGGLIGSTPKPLGYGWISIPNKETMVSDAGKLTVLDNLLLKLKSEGHRVLIYSQMTKMIDILEEFLWHRRYTYMRLDGSSKISDRRDMVADFQSRSDIFIFLLSTRAGGLGINLTAADTVIFYDSDWNPTVDQQAMDRAHRLGQTKQVTVYRLVCKDTIEERILQRAKEKSEIQRMVISGGEFAPDILKAKEVVSLLLDNEEMARRLCQKQEQRRVRDDTRRELTSLLDCKKRPKSKSGRGPGRPPKRLCLDMTANNPRDGTPQPPIFGLDDSSTVSDGSLSRPPTPKGRILPGVTANSETVTDDDSPSLFIDDQDSQQSSTGMPQIKVPRKRGRPKGTSNSSHASSSSSTNPSGLAPSRPRGRGSIQKSLSAAEAAALTAAKQAAFAAHGYTYSAEKLPSTTS